MEVASYSYQAAMHWELTRDACTRAYPQAVHLCAEPGENRISVDGITKFCEVRYSC
jgi:hypothetical protein